MPAGTDEVVALAKIVNLVKKGGFDRIVLDTAPTGHTLRMLSTPGFLADLIERLLRMSQVQLECCSQNVLDQQDGCCGRNVKVHTIILSVPNV